jgi:hypothetical protein
MMEVTEAMSSEGEGGPVMKVRNHATLTLLALPFTHKLCRPVDARQCHSISSRKV